MSSHDDTPNGPDPDGATGWDTSSPEAFVDQAMLTATQQRMSAEKIRGVAGGVSTEMFGHAGLAAQFNSLLGVLADRSDELADRTEAGAQAVWDAQQRAEQSRKDAPDEQ